MKDGRDQRGHTVAYFRRFCDADKYGTPALFSYTALKSQLFIFDKVFLKYIDYNKK